MHEPDVHQPDYEPLRPHEWGSVHVETFEEFLPRVQPLLPNFPVEVLKDWVYRHYRDAVDDWGWLNIYHLTFAREIWPTAQILEKVRPSRESLIDSWSWCLINERGFQENWLGRQMIETGTWPIPPIVLPTPTGMSAPDGRVLHAFHLVEGHHRLAYLHALNQHPDWHPQAQHDLWIVTVQPCG